MEAFFRAQQPIDLHLHSNVSDGTDTPAAVVRAAHAAGVRTMALTDHDTTAGWNEAIAECATAEMTFIGGMEITAEGPTGGGIHLLAYLFDPEESRLLEAVNQTLADRVPRAQEIVEKLSREYEITWDDVLVEAQGVSVGKPHIAAAMIKRGHIASADEFHTDLVAKGSRFHVASPAIRIDRAVELVRRAGGVPITAHPTARNKPGQIMPRESMIRLKEIGLGGFELDHPDNHNNPEGLARLREYVDEFNLIVTGSSDYHGGNKTKVPGEKTTSPEMLMRIIDEATGFAPIYA